MAMRAPLRDTNPMPGSPTSARSLQRAGERAVAAMRAGQGPAPATELERWFDAPWRRRVLRRALAHAPLAVAAALARCGERVAGVALEGAFWAGVRAAASAAEWRRLTRSSYVVFYYHRLAGEGKPGQERLDLPPELFERQLALLRRLRFRALSAAELIAFHDGSLRTLPARSYVVTADDGFLDCVDPFLRHAGVRPVLFVSSAEVGGRSWWAGGELLAGWDDLRRLAAAGVEIGSHAHRHLPLTDLDGGELREQLAGSRRKLGDQLLAAPSLLAYPHGRRDEQVLTAVREAGFRLAFTTDPGRNGGGSDPLTLRRIGVKAWDGDLSFIWKALTGELLPARWERRRISRAAPGYLQPPPTSRPRGD
jgi:peptidoglycan/xylan/chitin deacetylase (PgdA/CDA1 family)